jgi:hypothetical protein
VCGLWPWARVAVSQDEAAAAAAEKERAAAGKVLIVNLAMAPASSGGSQAAAAMAGAARLTSKVLLDALLQPGAPEPETEAEVCATEA